MILYKSIAAEIEKRIRSGIYKPGEKIPSIRSIAKEFACNKLTVQKAFNILKRDGFIENIVGSGSFVRFPEKIDRTIKGVFDFYTEYISEKFFPYKAAKKIFSELFDKEKTRAFSPPPVEGDPDLIKTLGEYYRIHTQSMLVISGAQQGLDLTAKVFATRISQAILFEDPTYPGAISLFRAKHFVPLKKDGPDLKRLTAKLSGRIKLFYTMPSVHNPTGISYSTEKKEAIAKLARRYSFYIIEDDYLSEFKENIGPRFVDIIPERTIYIKSLSQTTVSGIRLGFMSVPENLYDKFLYAKFSSDIASTGLLQKFLNVFMGNGDYEKYIESTKKRIAIRKKYLADIVNSYPNLCIPFSQSGYSLWICSRKPVTIPYPPWTPGEHFSFSPKFTKYFRISFMHIDDLRFKQGLLYINDLFNRFYK